MRGKTPFPVVAALVAIAITYRNNRLIADDVMPRVPVGKQEFRYKKFRKSEAFTVPDTLVGRRGVPSRVSFGYDEATGSTQDYGLEDAIPQSDIDNAPDGFSPVDHATESLMDLVLLDREVRVATTVTSAASYAPGNVIALTGAQQFSNPLADPVPLITEALDGVIMRPNVGVLGRAAFSALSQHPRVVKAANRNSGDSGKATREAIAELLELEALYVGEGFVNIAKPGQEPVIQRVWGNTMSLLYRDMLARPDGMRATWGFTAQWGTRIAGQWEDKNVGLRGGQIVRVGESVREVVSAPDLGVLLQNVVPQ